MLFKPLATLATCAILVPSVMGKFMTLSFNSKTDCKGSADKYRHYNENECHTLSATDYGVSIWPTGSGCTLYAYEADNCTGNRAPLEGPKGIDEVCRSLAGRWSVMVSDCP